MKLRHDALAFAAALLLFGLFFGGVFHQSLRGDSYIAPSDTLDFGVSTFLSPPSLWSDGMYSGYPTAADPQTLTWYPVLQLFRALDVPWNAFMIAAYVIAAAACFVLVRRLTGSILAAILGGLVFGFSGVMVAHISHFNQIHAAAWLPLIVYGLHVIRAGRPREGAVVAAAAYGLMWLAGHPQVAVYTFYLCAALAGGWLLLDRPDRPTAIRRAVWSGAGLMGGVCVAAVMILPMLELGELSRRADARWDLYIQDALPLKQLIALVWPLSFGGFLTPADVRLPYLGENSPVQTTSYVGLLPLALALVAVLYPSSIRREARLWLLLAGVALSLCLGPITPAGWLFYYVPGYSSFQLPARHLFLFTFCIAVAASLGFVELIRTAAVRRRAAVSVGAVVAAGVACAALVVLTTPAVRDLLDTHAEYRWWAFVVPLMVAGALMAVMLAGAQIAPRARWVGPAIAVVLLGLQAAELAVVHYVLPGYHFVYAEVPPGLVTPRPRIAALGASLRETGGRVLAVDGSRNRFLLPNLPRAWRIPAASGTGSLGIERYVDALRMGGSGDVPLDTFTPIHQGLDLLGVRYAMVPLASELDAYLRSQGDRWSVVEELRYSESDPDTWYALFANRRARPAAWCAGEAVPATAPQALAAIRTGHLPGGRAFDPARTVVLEKGDGSVSPAVRGIDDRHEVTASAVNDGERRYLVTSRVPCLLVVSEVFYPWWRASVDGVDAAVSRANHTLMSVEVPAGSHIVRLWLAPVSLWLGAAISVATLLAAAAVLALRGRLQ